MRRFIVPMMLMTSPAVAQEQFSLPEGCEAFLTVQGKSCTVSQHFICEGDPEGFQRRVDLVSSGPAFAGVIDTQTQWISSYYVFAETVESLMDDPVDPASFDDLLVLGRDTYDFNLESSDGSITRYAGEDNLTGRTVTIDGVDLLETTYQIESFDEAGDVTWRSAGVEFISEDWRMFISGKGTSWTPANGEYENDDTPVDFIFPAERGFLSTRPLYGCGESISFLSDTSQ